ncbi:MAG TPA: hypothetical protein VF092_22970 [Longimicrobium sp.]
MTNERKAYLCTAVAGCVAALGMLYVLARVVTSRQPALLIAAVALACVEGAILTWIAYRRFRFGRAADIARWVRAGGVLTWMVLVLLFAPRI